MSTGWSSGGSFKNTEAWLKSLQNKAVFDKLEHYGTLGVNALRAATPVETGVAAGSWGYEIIRDATSWSIVWTNSDMAGPTPVVILLQMGHGTGTGGWVEGRDFINPAMRPILDQMANDGWKAVVGT